ncbi:hypothetical protein [Pseudomonas sp. NCCP-436]|uniref:hypothetical protein n=1 Tax=Pseudomonas sp. NCCP-436 TaxID=2842481 RepID=UPI001C819893|nr:hypothetical protein [Pseudomonas sp. NCCP-436]GIZ12226.1 hypothetical protein NCCP436_16420 [Pseudomonas sp. NCCP-436]
MSFLELVGLVSAFSSITGVTLNGLAKTPFKNEVSGYIADLETRSVLWAELDLEVKQAVISSMEDILANSRQLLSTCSSDPELKKVIQAIVNATKTEVSNIYSFDDKTRQGQYKIFMSLQKFRTEMARALSTLCAALGIEPSKSELRLLITNMATVRPRT